MFGSMDVSRIIIRLIADASQYFTTFNRVIRATRQGAQEIGMAAGTIVTRAFAAVTMGLVGAIAALAVSFTAAGVAAVSLASEYERTTVAFTVLTGNAEMAKKVLDDLTQFAIESPFKVQELAVAAKQIAAFGFSTDQVPPIMRALGDVSAGTGTELRRLILAFGQIHVAQRLMGPELRQLTDAGVPIIKVLAKELQIPTTRFRDLVYQGRITSNEVIGAFNKMTQAGGLFAGMTEAYARTVTGRWHAMVESVQVVLRNVGLAFFEGFDLSGLLDQITGAITDAAVGVDKLVPIFQKARDVFNAVASGVAALAMALGHGLKGAINSVVGTSIQWDDFRDGIVAAVKGIVAAIITLTNAIGKLATETLPFFLKQMSLAMGFKPGQVPAAEAAMRSHIAQQPSMRSRLGLQLVGGIARSGPFLGPTVGVATFAAAELGKQAGVPLEVMDKIQSTSAIMGQALHEIASVMESSTFKGADVNAVLRDMDMAFARLSERSIKQLIPAVSSVAGAFATAEIKAISAKEAISKTFGLGFEIDQLIGDLNKTIGEGSTPFSQFKRQMDLLDEAFLGAGGTPLASIIGAAAIEPGISPDTFKFGVAEAFRALRKEAGEGAGLPTARLAGSKEALDLMNEVQGRTNANLEDIRGVLERALAEHESLVTEAEKINKTLNDIKNDPKKDNPIKAFKPK